MGRYFKIVEDSATVEGRWYLGDLRDAAGSPSDPRKFTEGVPLHDVSTLRLKPQHHGMRTSFTFADFDAPVVAAHHARDLSELAGDSIQMFPVAIDGVPEGAYQVLNVVNAIDCIDRSNSIITWWRASDGRPDKVGKPRMVVKLALVAEKLSGADIFRVKDWEIALIVSERIRDVLVRGGVTGVKFREVEITRQH